MTITELQDGFRAKRFSAVEVMRNTLEKIDARDKELHAFLEVYAESALSAAELVDTARDAGGLGPLAGVPLAIKDNLLDEGHIASAGSRILEKYRAPYTATAVERLRRAGAIIVGRTNMDEFAMGSSTENSAFGPTRNPHNTACVPGGSSGGSAAAVAAGFVPAALGSDTGGSIRQPAALCGVVGLKPTYGRVSRYGLMAMASSLDQIGPLTTSCEDAALLLSIISGTDPNDATCTPQPAFTWTSRDDISGLKVGLPKECFNQGLDPHIESHIRAVVGDLARRGAEIVEVSLPRMADALAAYYVIVPAEVSSNMARYDGVRYGARTVGDTLAEMYATTRGQHLGAEVRRRILLGTYVLSAGYSDAYYRKALAVRTLVRRDFDAAFTKVDVLLTPTSPSVAWPIGEKFADPLTMYLSDIYTVAVNVAGLPAVSVPCGTSQGLPVGAQLIGKAYDEHTLLSVGQLVESMGEEK